MEATEVIFECSKLFQLEGFDVPVSIEVCRKTAERLNSELKVMLKYSSQTRFRANECLFNGILIVAPKNFCFTRD